MSNREKLPANAGMLFVFDQPDYHSFWMKDMLFAIDIIWIDENKKIVDITHNAEPESYPKIFQPSSPAQYVLEVNSFWAAEHGIVIGDVLNFNLNELYKMLAIASILYNSFNEHPAIGEVVIALFFSA